MVSITDFNILEPSRKLFMSRIEKATPDFIKGLTRDNYYEKFKDDLRDFYNKKNRDGKLFDDFTSIRNSISVSRLRQIQDNNKGFLESSAINFHKFCDSLEKDFPSSNQFKEIAQADNILKRLPNPIAPIFEHGAIELYINPSSKEFNIDTVIQYFVDPLNLYESVEFTIGHGIPTGVQEEVAATEATGRYVDSFTFLNTYINEFDAAPMQFINFYQNNTLKSLYEPHIKLLDPLNLRVKQLLRLKIRPRIDPITLKTNFTLSLTLLKFEMFYNAGVCALKEFKFKKVLREDTLKTLEDVINVDVKPSIKSPYSVDPDLKFSLSKPRSIGGFATGYWG